MLAVVSPVLHKKSPFPVAVKVVLSPTQILISLPTVNPISGLTLIIISSVASVEHELLEVTEYVVVAVGFTVILDSVSPVLHKKLPEPSWFRFLDHLFAWAHFRA